METGWKFEAADDLFSAADTASEGVPEPLRYSIFLYFLSRYFVATFEARFGALPLQVWNEYRNTLDHFFRHVTLTDPNSIFSTGSDHLKKMEGHAQRAVLDICKITCHASQEHLDKLILEHGQDVLELVNDGTFYSKLLTNRQNAIRTFENAKVIDSGLGPDNTANRDIVGTYVHAAFDFQKLIASFDDRGDVILRCRQRVLAQRRRHEVKSIFLAVGVNLASAGLGFLIALALPTSFTDAVSQAMASVRALF